MSAQILLVDDHVDTVAAFAKLLRLKGHEVLPATRYMQALQIAESLKPGLLICDLELRDGDGCDLLRAIRLHYPVEGIAVSGHAFPADVARCKAAGFSHHLAKPISLERVLAAIAEIYPPGRTEAFAS